MNAIATKRASRHGSCRGGVLIIHPDTKVGSSIRAGLKRQRIPADHVRSYSEGLRRVQNDRPLLVAIHTTAGRMSIPEVVQRVRSIDAEVGSIVLGDPTNEDQVIGWMRAGVIDVARKNLSKERVIELLASSWKRKLEEPASGDVLDVIDTVEQPMVLWDRYDRLTYCNERFRALHDDLDIKLDVGLTFDEFVESTKRTRNPNAENISAMTWQRASSSSSDTTKLVDYRFRGRWFQISKRKRRDGSVISIWTDITDQKVSEQEAQTSRNRIEDFLHLAVDRYWELDADLRFTFAGTRPSSSKELMKQAVGKHPWDSSFRKISPATATAMKSLLESREPIDGFEYAAESIDGRTAYNTMRAVPIYTENNKFRGYRGVTIDHTDVVLAQQALAKKQDRFDSALENIDQGVALWDQQDRLVGFNHQFASFNGDRASLLEPGIRFEDFARAYAEAGDVEGSNDPGFKRRWVKDRIANFKRRAETSVVELDGRTFHLQRKTLIDGSTLSINSDVTEFVEREEKLQRQTKLAELLHRTATAANAAPDGFAALQTVVTDVCETLGFDLGHVYVLDSQESGRLVSSNVSYGHRKHRYRSLVKAMREMSFEMGQGAPGKVCKSGTAAWEHPEPGLRRGPRSEIFGVSGIRTTLFSPIMIGNEGVGVLEFFSDAHQDKQEDVLAALAQIGTQLGRAIERQRAAMAVSRSEKRFRDFANLAANRFWESDAEHRITYISESSGSLRPINQGMLGGRLWESDKRMLEPGTAATMKKLFQAKKPFSNFLHEAQLADGRKVVGRMSATPIYDEKGNFAGYRGVTVDDTKFVNAQRALQENEKRFFDALEYFDDGASLWDADERLVYCNSKYRDLAGERGSVLRPGVLFEEFIRHYAETGPVYGNNDPEFKETWVTKRLETFRNNSSLVEEWEDGRCFSLRRERLPDGSCVSFRTDITEFKRRETRLQHQADLTALLHRTARISNQATSIEEALEAVLKDVCESLNFSLGHAHLVDGRDPTYLDPSNIWFGAEYKKFRPFLNATVNHRFARGEGAPGDAYQAGIAIWETLAGTKFEGPRTAAAKACGINTTVFSPILIGEEVGGILEFFSAEEMPEQQDVLDALTQVGTQLGRTFERQRASEELVAKQEQFREFAGLAADRFWEVDSDIRFTLLSSTGDRFVGEASDMIGAHPWENHAHELPPEVVEQIKQAFASKEPIADCRFEATNHDGSIAYLKFTANPILDSDGRFEGYRGVTVDETGIVTAQRRMASNQMRFHDALDSLDESAALWDEEGRFVYSNQRFREFHGERSALLKDGVHYSDFIRAYAEQGPVLGRNDAAFKSKWVDERIKHFMDDGGDTEVGARGRWYRLRRRRFEDGSMLSLRSDITEFKQREEKLEVQAELANLMHRTASISNESMDAGDAIQRVIADVCRSLGFNLGHAYLIDKNDDSTLVPTKLWYGSRAERYRRLVEVTEATEFEFGRGGPGQVCKTGIASWEHPVPGLKRGPRSHVYVACGIQTSLFTPIMIGDAGAGVLEFFADEALEESAETLAVLAQIGTQLGRAIERQRAEEALRQSEERFKDFATQGADRFWELDKDLRYVFVSQVDSADKTPISQLIGYCPWEVTSRANEPDFVDLLRPAFESREKIENLRYTTPNRNGEQVFIRFSATPIYDSDGGFAGYRGVTVNETKVVGAENALVQNRQRFYEAFDDLNYAAALWDAEDRFVGCNQQYRRLFGDYGHLLVEGIKFDEFIHAQAAAQAQDGQVVNPETPQSVSRRLELHRRCPEREEIRVGDRWVLVRTRKLDDGSTLWLRSDITEFKDRERELQDAQEGLLAAERLAALGKLTGSVAHELRNPLGTIRTTTEVIKRRLGNAAPEMEKPLSRLWRNVDRCDRIITDLLDFTGKPNLSLRPINLDKWLEDHFLEQPVPQDIKFDWQPGLPGEKVSLDAERFRQAVINIAENAYQAIQEHSGSAPPTMAVRTSRVNNRIEVTFDDTGLGVPEEARRRIFEPLFSTKSFGVGLGLPTVQQILEAHGGGVEVSDSPAGGARFVLWLPADDR